MADTLNWGIIGTGGIAHTFARGVQGSTTGKLVAVGSRTQESADKFGDEFDIPQRHASYEALLADAEVQAVYISTPHPLHAEWAIKAAEAGKHILCEKPLTLNYHAATAVVEAAREHDVFLMEAFMYRCHPQTAKLVELIRSGAIGKVLLIHATFSFQAGFNPEGRLFKNALGGGGILDVGCYTTSMTRLIAGAANGQDFAEPLELKAVGHIGESHVDEYTVAVAKFPGEIVAQLATGVRMNGDNIVRVVATEGSIVVPSPWIPSRNGEPTTLTLNKHGQPSEEITVEVPAGLYALEADTVARNLEAREAKAMAPADTLGNLKMLDAWRAAIGVTYEAEAAQAYTRTAANRPLQRRAGHNMKYGRVPGVTKAMSRLVFGCDNQGSMAHGAVVWDDFFERGGNAFDTAFIYGGGAQEKLLGQWMKNHGIREQVVVITKGAHSPHCNPADLTKQLRISLDRLGSDYTDIYMMHRDNPDIPAGEFIDVLNEHVQAGRIKAFGGSNWSLERVDEANTYAASKGLQGFSGVSNNFSLARMVDPVWGGCIHASDAASRAWFEKTQLVLLPWSSQARGFFVRGDRDFTADEELVRCWYADDNFARLERVQKLSRERGWTPINIALAYVLNQPFPTFPLIGPRMVEETRSSLGALDIELTPQELRWLNLEA